MKFNQSLCYFEDMASYPFWTFDELKELANLIFIKFTSIYTYSSYSARPGCVLMCIPQYARGILISSYTVSS